MTNEQAIENLVSIMREERTERGRESLSLALQALRGWQAVDSLKDEVDVLGVVFQRDDARTKCTVERHSWSSASDHVAYGPDPATAAIAAEEETL